MGTLLLKNIGNIVTGRIDDPVRDADTILVRDRTIEEIATTTTTADTIIDVKGLTVTPGLIDAHVHPVIGGYTPRQNALGWPESYLHCGVTSMVSAGEVHVPGRPKDVAGVKSLAILARKAFENHRPGGAKVRAGTLLASDDLSEEAVDEANREGVKRIKFLSPLDRWDHGRRIAEWAEDRGMVTIMHTGSSSFQAEAIEFDAIRQVRPDICAHIAGGPIAMSGDQVFRTVAETDSALELVIGGNQRLAIDLVNEVEGRNELDRLQLGTDTPSGTGVVSRGMLLQIALLAGLTDVPASDVLCMATGNSTDHHDLQEGIVEEGRPADLCIMGPSVGSASEHALASLDSGELPSIDVVIVDGEILVEGSRNMPPAKTPPTIEV